VFADPKTLHDVQAQIDEVENKIDALRLKKHKFASHSHAAYRQI
jgi:hypothetical protein